MALVLIVDDSPTDVHVMQKALEQHGFRTEAASTGGEGLRLARELQPDLILMDIVMPGVNGYQATRELANDPATRTIPGDHGHLQGAGVRSRLGPAPGRRRLPGEAGRDGTTGAQGPGRHFAADMQPGVTPLRSLRDRPFELLREIDRRARAAAQGQPETAAAGAEWVGVAFRLGGEAFLIAREETREVLAYPASVTRVPGARAWIRGLSNVRGQLLPMVDLRPFLGAGATAVSRTSRVLVANHREIPAGLVVDEVMGFRRFYESEFSADLPPTLLRCERYLAGAFRRGAEVWPVFSIRALLESPQFMQAAAS